MAHALLKSFIQQVFFFVSINLRNVENERATNGRVYRIIDIGDSRARGIRRVYV